VNPRYVAAAVLSATAALAAACDRDGCVGGDDGTCIPPAACTALRYACGAGSGMPRVGRIGDGVMPVSGSKARGASGDILLENDLVRVVIDAPSHPSGMAPTGGSIIDLAPAASDSGDQINSIYQAAGLLPRDAVHYDSFHVDEHSSQDTTDAFVAVVFRGHLEGDSRVTVVTRYELRACEPGVRVRSDLYNGAPDPNTLYLTDGFFWGDNSAAPFVPGIGLGFRAPKLDLLDVASAWREWPFVAARTQSPPDVSYAVVPCDRPQSAGFNDPTLTASGVPLATTLPGDGMHFERFIIATPGPGLAPAVGEALRVRAMVHGEPPPVTISGRVVAGGRPVDALSGRAASLLFYEPAFGPAPDDPARRLPWSEVVPGNGGRFSVTLPPDRAYRVQPYAFGLPAGPPTSFVVSRQDADIGDLTLTASAHLAGTVATTTGQTTPEMMTYAELVIVPVAPAAGAEPPSLYGLFAGCNPMLGPRHGGTPACNRALTHDGRFDLLIPAGQYYVYATRGPFASLDRQTITLGPGDEEKNMVLVVESLPSLLPAGVVSGDFHVHGAASFDSAIPDQDRVVSFLAAGVDVIIATDHDVVTSYESTLADLSATDRITVISGVEQTPNIPWFAVPGEDFPKTLGHFNFWPLAADPTLPRNRAPWDELREPGQMMDDMELLFMGAGVRQLNHPFAESKLGRDQGFLRAIGYDPRTPIAPGVSFAADVLLRAPGAPGGRRNLDWDVQEVMTGSSLANWLRYRALWFSLLSQGIVRAGTANSDSHSLSLEQVGYPRNLVFGAHQRDAIDIEAFDEDVRRGHLVGTNGPVLEVTIEDGGPPLRPGLDPIQVSASAQLVIKVAAAPWIPVTELRVIVNGNIVGGAEPGQPIDISEDFIGAVHTGRQANALDPPVSLPLASLLAGVDRDAWLIVEVGVKLPATFDADGDGLPEIVERGARPEKYLEDFQAIVPGGWPIAFTNPFLIDRDGGDWQAPGLP
jgi:hypothetical protein